ncbi:MAG: ABC transporter permease [Synergistaceae bacterium]|nr:ABC transporter permease [Synergistaceae bacterium]
MSRYVLKRLLLLIPVLLGVTFIIYTIMAIQPGDPGRMILGENASQEAVDKLNEQLGVNEPFFTRFFNYVYNAVFKLDFGTSYRTSQPVFNDVFARAGTSFKIAFNGMLMATVIGIPLGVLSAVKQYSHIDTFSRITAMLAAAIPPFWLGMMLIFIFSLKLRILPSNGIDSWRNFILPMVTLGIPYAGSQLRMTRSTMLETIRQDYIRTAKAKGVPNGVIVFKHALRNALLPIITITATSFGGLLGGAVITESVFSMPGLGTLIVTGIRQRDTPSVLAATLFLAFMFGIIMLFVDLLYAFVDPRIKAKYSR